jgi:hypothetical protein
MEIPRESLQSMSWGVLIIACAVSLLLMGIIHISVFTIIPLVLLIMGLWITVVFPSFIARAWGVILASAGGLWLLHSVYPLIFPVRMGIFLAILGILVLLGTKK